LLMLLSSFTVELLLLPLPSMHAVTNKSEQANTVMILSLDIESLFRFLTVYRLE
jgi:hypothetical protein